MKAGDLVKATVMARPAEHLIAWVVEFPATGRRFSHSTWQGMLLAPEDLIRAHPERVPHLSREGQARVTVLGYCDGRRTAREIEQAVLRDHPDLFPSPEEISLRGAGAWPGRRVGYDVMPVRSLGRSRLRSRCRFVDKRCRGSGAPAAMCPRKLRSP